MALPIWLKRLLAEQDILIVYHKNCIDGVTSAGLMAKFLTLLGFTRLNYLAYFPDFKGVWPKADVVILVDCVITIEPLLALIEQSSYVVLIDHHRDTAQAVNQLVERTQRDYYTRIVLNSYDCGVTLVLKEVELTLSAELKQILEAIRVFDVFDRTRMAELRGHCMVLDEEDFRNLQPPEALQRLEYHAEHYETFCQRASELGRRYREQVHNIASRGLLLTPEVFEGASASLVYLTPAEAPLRSDIGEDLVAKTRVGVLARVIREDGVVKVLVSVASRPGDINLVGGLGGRLKGHPGFASCCLEQSKFETVFGLAIPHEFIPK